MVMMTAAAIHATILTVSSPSPSYFTTMFEEMGRVVIIVSRIVRGNIGLLVNHEREALVSWTSEVYGERLADVASSGEGDIVDTNLKVDVLTVRHTSVTLDVNRRVEEVVKIFNGMSELSGNCSSLMATDESLRYERRPLQSMYPNRMPCTAGSSHLRQRRRRRNTGNVGDTLQNLGRIRCEEY